MLVMDWNRYESRHASFSPALVSTINFLNSRVVPVPEGKRRCTFSWRCGCSGSFGRFIISWEVSVVYDWSSFFCRLWCTCRAFSPPPTPPQPNSEPWWRCSSCVMRAQCLCARGYMNVIAPPHPPPHPTHPKTLKGNCVADEGEMVSQIPERYRHLQDCVADEGKMVSRMSENQGCLVSNLREIWCHRWGAYPTVVDRPSLWKYRTAISSVKS